MAEPIPLHPRKHRPERPGKSSDDDLILCLPAPRPFLEPGIYDARSSAVRRKHFFAHHFIEVIFTVFKGSFADGGEILATGVPGFYNLAEDGRSAPGPASELARLMLLFNGGADGVRLSDLKNKLWRVEVSTVLTDRRGKPLATPYSKVQRVIERLA